MKLLGLILCLPGILLGFLALFSILNPKASDEELGVITWVSLILTSSVFGMFLMTL